MKRILHVLARKDGGVVVSGLAMMRGKFKCQGVLLFRIIGQGPFVFAVFAGSCGFGYSLPRREAVRYRLTILSLRVINLTTSN